MRVSIEYGKILPEQDFWSKSNKLNREAKKRRILRLVLNETDRVSIRILLFVPDYRKHHLGKIGPDSCNTFFDDFKTVL